MQARLVADPSLRKHRHHTRALLRTDCQKRTERQLGEFRAQELWPAEHWQALDPKVLGQH